VSGGHPPELELALRGALAASSERHPGLSFRSVPSGWAVEIPEALRVGHEAHFAQVMRSYLSHLEAGGVPPLEVANALARYYVTTRGYALSRPHPEASEGTP
jgi:hypothetical protein